MLGPYSDRLSDGKRVLPLAASAAPANVVAVIVHGPLGIPAAVLGLRINLVDLHGLAEPIAAHMLLEGRGRPGHEKWFSAPWFAARYASAGATSDPREPAARAALPCGDVAVLTRAIREPMSLARFFTNLKLAFTLHHLRIPADPARAQRDLCGS
jgi:arabinofuranosyltransferase